MVIRFYNAKILQNNKIVEGDLVVYNNLIAYIGNSVQEIRYDREIDLKGNLIIPTLKNVHTHSPMTFLRSIADDMPLHEWLNNRVFVAEKYLNEDYVYWLQKLAILEYLKNGIGLISDMYFFREPIAYASSECGIRNTLVFGVSDEVEKTMPLEKALDYTEILKKANKDSQSKLVDAKVGLHAEYTCSLDVLERVSKIANERKEPVFLHMSETKKEVEDCIVRYKKTPVQLFEDLNLFNYGATLYHMVHPKEEDFNILKQRKINVVTCPASNCKLASGIAPVKKMLDMGINVSLGTDGPASNNSLDMFKEMYLLSLLQKVDNFDAKALKAEDVIDIATKNGAKAVGRKGFDGLDNNQYADFVVIDINKPNMRPHNNLVSSLVYSASADNVIMTVVDGKILYDNGQYFINEDVDKIYRMSELIAKDIKSKINA